MHVVVLKVFCFCFKLNSIGTCQFRYPSDGQLQFMQNQCCQGGCGFGISQTELLNCTLRIIDQVYMVTLVSFFIFLVKASLKLVVYTCICGYTVERNCKEVVWLTIDHLQVVGSLRHHQTAAPVYEVERSFFFFFATGKCFGFGLRAMVWIQRFKCNATVGYFQKKTLLTVTETWVCLFPP